MFVHIRRAVVALVLLTLLTGVAYPLVVTGIARVFVPAKSAGSLSVRDGVAVGSRLLGQQFDDPKYFWGRLSATGAIPYDGLASAGSNLGPTNPALLDRTRERVRLLRDADRGNSAPIPVDLVTASASGLDPNISEASALFQVPRVARLRALDEARVRSLVLAHTETPDLRVFGERRVSVLELNLEMDSLK